MPQCFVLFITKALHYRHLITRQTISQYNTPPFNVLAPGTSDTLYATVTSRLDYCNSLLYGAKQSHIDRLQCCQNNAARIISKRRKFDHISPVLRELHWLPMEHRISYKILLLTYKALNGHAPQYLAALISKYVPPRPLRSSIHHDGGLKHLESELSPRQPRPFGTLYPSA